VSHLNALLLSDWNRRGGDTGPTLLRIQGNSFSPELDFHTRAYFVHCKRCFRRQNLHVRETVRLLTPRALKDEFPDVRASNRTVVESRESVLEILEQKDPAFIGGGWSMLDS